MEAVSLSVLLATQLPHRLHRLRLQVEEDSRLVHLATRRPRLRLLQGLLLVPHLQAQPLQRGRHKLGLAQPPQQRVGLQRPLACPLRAQLRPGLAPRQRHPQRNLALQLLHLLPRLRVGLAPRQPRLQRNLAARLVPRPRVGLVPRQLRPQPNLAARLVLRLWVGLVPRQPQVQVGSVPRHLRPQLNLVPRLHLVLVLLRPAVLEPSRLRLRQISVRHLLPLLRGDLAARRQEDLVARRQAGLEPPRRNLAPPRLQEEVEEEALDSELVVAVAAVADLVVPRSNKCLRQVQVGSIWGIQEGEGRSKSSAGIGSDEWNSERILDPLNMNVKYGCS